MTKDRRQTRRSLSCGKPLAGKTAASYLRPWRVWRSPIAGFTPSRQQNHARIQRLTLHPPNQNHYPPEKTKLVENGPTYQITHPPPPLLATTSIKTPAI